jgi:anti-sigma B factor antagonist
MGFHATSRRAGKITIVDVEGDLTFIEAGLLRALVNDLAAKGQKRIVLNLRGLKRLDSSGIGELARAYASIRQRGGDLKVLHLAPHIAEILQLVRLHTVLEDFDSEQRAIESFS